MVATALRRPGRRTPRPLPDAPASTMVRKVTGRRVLFSEWGKFWSLRSSWITLGVALLLLIVIGSIASATWSPDATASTAGGPPGMAPTGSSNAVSLALTGISFAQLAVGVLGVLVSAGEYSTGMIRSTLAAVPRRLPVLWSKSAVFGAIALVVTTVGVVAAFQLGSAGLSGKSIALSLGDSGVLSSLLGAGLYLGLVGVFGVALGVVVRSTAGGIAALVGILLILPGLANLLPTSMYNSISPYFPSTAGQAGYALHHASHTLSPGAGLAVFAGWVALALVAAAVRLRRTDV
jgi:ABC-2 type transport system permease protein